MTGKHASLPPSASARWSACPGSIALEASIPEAEREGSSPYAQLGTAAHGLLERCLAKGHDPHDYIGRTIELIGPEESVSILAPGAKEPRGATRVWFEVDEGMADAVKVATDYVRASAADAVVLERRVRVLEGREDCYGTADVIMDTWPDLLECVDYKHGSGVVVEVAGNSQLRSYLLGAAREDRFSHDHYRYTIVQPRAPHADGPVRTEDVSREELLEHEARLAGAAQMADEALALLNSDADAGEVMDAVDHNFLEAGDHCQWCQAKAICPAFRRLVAEKAQADFDDEPHELEVPTDLDVISRLLPWIPLIDGWARSVEAHAQRAAEAGRRVPGHKLVRKRSTRRWNDELDLEDILDTMEERFGVPRSEMLEVKMLTGPQAEKKVEKGLRGEFETELLVKPEGGVTLAPEDDPRDEVVIDPVADFDDVED